MPTTLPPKVILYVPTRAVHKALILMDVVQEGTPLAWSLKPVETHTDLKWGGHPVVSSTTYLGQFIIRNCTGILLNKQIRMHNSMLILDNAGVQIPVVSMSQHTTVFGSHALKTNVYIQPLPDPALPAPASAPAPAPAPKKKNKLTPYIPHGSELRPYVAKQLFELAVLRKEMCPITAEEFSAGNTAVMPCGHLFMQMAIEESFKKETNKCPWCRQEGKPTYV